MSIVVIEGPDGVGKTTLARAYADLTGARYLHASAPTAHPLVEYVAPLRDDVDYVLDRWHLGELVYGPIVRGKSGLTHQQSHAIEQMMIERGAVLVHCNGPYDKIVARLRGRGDEPHKTLRQEATAFKLHVERSYLPLLQSPIGMEITPEEIRDAVAST